MYWTWHAPPTLLELESLKRGAVGRRSWAQQLGPPHRLQLGGGVSTAHHLASPGTTYPLGNRLPLVRRPLPSGRRLGRGDDWGRGRMWSGDLFWASLQNRRTGEKKGTHPPRPPPGTLCGRACTAHIRDRPAPNRHVRAWRTVDILECAMLDGPAYWRSARKRGRLVWQDTHHHENPPTLANPWRCGPRPLVQDDFFEVLRLNLGPSGPWRWRHLLAVSSRWVHLRFA